MKTIGLTVVSFAFVCIAISQPNNNPYTNAYPKTVSVSGTAEMDIVPDEIYVQVDLREYEKKGSGKIDIETIKKKFLDACRNAGIADSLISIASYQGMDRSYWLSKKKKNPDMMAGISYWVKLNTTKKMDELVEKLDDEATQGFYIAKTSHSRIEAFRKQLKIQAVKAAKEKAIYLSEAIGEKAGEAVTIQEPVDYSVLPIYKNINVSNTLLKYKTSDEDNTEETAVDFKKIKLKFEVNAVFALK